ncbi:MAG: hypothetical protein VX466_10365 [Myxococcota bacterium]|nr:hypothetical protein [Myxococcota bacterium]
MRLLLLISTGVLCLLATAAQAGSALVFSPPPALGPIPAGT